MSERAIDPTAEPKQPQASSWGSPGGDPVSRVLLLAKAIHQRGDELSRTGSDLDAMIAIHHVHLAVEMTLREIASRRGLLLSKKDQGFDDLLQRIEASMREAGDLRGLPHVGSLRTLNGLRNSVQHAAQFVHAEMVNEQCILTRDFLREMYGRSFGIDYDGVSERDLVTDNNLRALLHHAHALAEIETSETLPIALAALRFCLEGALQSWPSHLPSPEGSFLAIIPREREVMERIQALEEETTLLTTRVDVLEYRWLLQHAPRVLTADDGSITIDTTGLEHVPPESVQRAERFVIGCIMSWQRLSLHPHYVGEETSVAQFAELATSLGSSLEH